MPDFLYDWNIWWANWWHDHPTVYWVTISLTLIVYIVWLKRRKR